MMAALALPFPSPNAVAFPTSSEADSFDGEYLNVPVRQVRSRVNSGLTAPRLSPPPMRIPSDAGSLEEVAAPSNDVVLTSGGAALKSSVKKRSAPDNDEEACDRSCGDERDLKKRRVAVDEDLALASRVQHIEQELASALKALAEPPYNLIPPPALPSVPARAPPAVIAVPVPVPSYPEPVSKVYPPSPLSKLLAVVDDYELSGATSTIQVSLIVTSGGDVDMGDCAWPFGPAEEDTSGRRRSPRLNSSAAPEKPKQSSSSPKENLRRQALVNCAHKLDDSDFGTLPTPTPVCVAFPSQDVDMVPINWALYPKEGSLLQLREDMCQSRADRHYNAGPTWENAKRALERLKRMNKRKKMH